MFRSLGSVFCVVVLAAFVFGCGGGGGGTTTGGGGTMPEPAEPTTDAQRIADAQQMVATILSNARARALAASSTANSLQTNTDATAAHMASARDRNTEAQAALRLIESANTDALAATTPDEAETALANARTALSNLSTAASAISTIRSAVQAITSARNQREMDETARTGGSSLIQHLSDNKKVSDAVLAALAPGSLLVGATDSATGSAAYPYHKGATPTQYPRPANTDRGVRGVTVSVNGTNVSSDSQTGKISGSGRLSSGFDVKDGDGRFATVYTDIAVATRIRQRNGNNLVEDTTPDDGINQKYQYVADTDYLLAGIWLNDTTGAPVLRAFAFGSQPLTATHDFCTAADVTNTSTLTRECASTSDTNMITGFVGANESEDATYSGGVNGAYFAGGKTSHFKANVSLTANFVRGSGTDVEGSKISGEITKIVAGGDSITGSIDLKEQPLTNTLSAFEAGEAAGVIEGHAYTGNWKGQFFGMRAKRETSTFSGTVAGGDRTESRTYKPQAPGSVAGSFYVDRETVGEGEAAFIGAFGAHR